MKSLTILVAEDDMLSRMVLERSVVQWGYQLVSAADGESARALLESREIDVCLVDWDMPKMSGIEICRWLRDAGNLKTRPYVILVTGKDQPEDIQAAYEAGADDYLTKPCDLRYLRRRIITVAEKRQCQKKWVEEAGSPDTSIAALGPLDLYFSDLRLMRRKT